MEKLLNMRSSCSTSLLFAALILVMVQPARAEKKHEQVVAPPAMTASTMVTALARQIAFVKTFSVEYPYQYGQETHNEETGNNEKNRKMRPE
ncbi:MAG: hypothetical protein H6Q52_3324 [Deltaproteobacteria bacterium]|nr:hypothetical protein [Deltaproteobacteria bacterium]